MLLMELQIVNVVTRQHHPPPTTHHDDGRWTAAAVHLSINAHFVVVVVVVRPSSGCRGVDGGVDISYGTDCQRRRVVVVGLSCC